MELISIAIWISLGFIILGYLFAFIRLAKGPSLPDRAVALDLIALLTLAVAALHALSTDTAIFLNVSLVIALITFLGTVAFAQYLERIRPKSKKENKDD